MDEAHKPFALLKSSMPIRTVEFMHNMFVKWIKFCHLYAICKLHMNIYSNGKVSSLTPLENVTMFVGYYPHYLHLTLNVAWKDFVLHLSCVSKVVPQNRHCPFVWHRKIGKPIHKLILSN